MRPSLQSRFSVLDRRYRNDLILFGMTLLFVVILGWVIHGPVGRDDVYKTFWPAHTLATRGEIVNYNGEAMEQSSSLLQVLVLGFSHALTGFPLPALALAYGLLATASSAVLVGRILKRLDLEPVWPAALVGVLPPVVYWSWSGMETALAALCATWFVLETMTLWRRRIGWTFVLSVFVLLLVRPEFGLVMLGSMVLLALLRKVVGFDKEIHKRLLQSTLLIAASMLALGLFRWAWMGSWVPQPVVAKESAIGWGRSYVGMAYVWHGLWRQPVLVLLGGGGIWALVHLLRGKLDPRMAVSMAFGVVFLVVIVAAGGDWMENVRLLVPVLPLCLTFLVAWISRSGKSVQAALAILTVASVGYGAAGIALRDSSGSPAWARVEADGKGFFWTERANRIHARDLELVGRLRNEVDGFWLSEGRAPVVLSQQAGFVMYHLGQTHYGRFRFIDLVGLCSREFTSCGITRSRGSGFGGVNMDLFFLMDNIEELHLTCGIPFPDIIFDLDHEGQDKQKKLLQHGYQIRWRASGQMDSKGWGMEVEKGQFLAVKSPMDTIHSSAIGQILQQSP